jgi:hypothetical protein
VRLTPSGGGVDLEAPMSGGRELTVFGGLAAETTSE